VILGLGKKEKIPKAFVCYEITPHEWPPSIHAVHEVHVAVPTDLNNPKSIKAANKKAMAGADNWIRKWNNTDESIEFFLTNHNPTYYFKEFELGKNFFLYGLLAVPPSGVDRATLRATSPSAAKDCHSKKIESEKKI
jgi:hypothetical protein